MSDESASPTQRDDETVLSLSDLPIEIFLHICSFLDASTLVHGLGLVCMQFHEILDDDSLWKARISQIWPNTGFPVLPPAEEDELFWKLSCVAIEKQASLWGKDGKAENMEKLLLSNVHYGTIDGIMLMDGGKVCITGGRDRCLVYWMLPEDKEDEESHPPRTVITNNAHEGWIWDLTAIGNTVYSCSWDRTVKAWDLTDAGLVHLTTYEMCLKFRRIITGAVLCVTSCPDLSLFAAGSFCKSVLVYDPRTAYCPVARFQPHQRAVIGIAMSPNYILSGSEDRTVSIWDQRAGKTMKSVKISKESYPRSISMQKGVVYVGDTAAKLHILDPKKDFERVKCYQSGHRKAITGVHQAPGCLITSSLDKTVKISSPTNPPQVFSTLHSSHGEIASMDYLNEVLAVSGADAIEVWRPRSRA